MVAVEVLRKTRSLCPTCLRVVDAEVYAGEGGVVRIRKTCPDHGESDDTYTFSDYELYRWAEKYTHEGVGVENPRTKTVRNCPFDCGLCPNHKSHTVLAIIDVTNRCNIKCPVCFANAATLGYVYEPTLEQIRSMLVNLRENKPVPPPALQLSGGEPTVRDDLPDIIKMAKELGFRHIEVNTNGIRLARDPNYYRELLDAGMSTLYLQFDGVTEEPYLKLRGAKLLEIKEKAIFNAKMTEGFESIVLVVTLAKGVNDHQMGSIIDYALKNSDVIRCINVQPISFSGRATSVERQTRINTTDFMKLVEEQTQGLVTRWDFRPVPSVVPVSKAVGSLKNKRYVEFTASPFCGVATFIVQRDDGSWVPITKLSDTDSFFKSMEKVYDDMGLGRKTRARMRVLSSLRHVKFGLLKSLMLPVIKEGSYDALGKFMRRVVMLGCMHFMDAWNFDLQRVERCVIHYALPDGTIIPFCTHNSIHRQKVEEKFSTPYKTWVKGWFESKVGMP